MGPFKQRLNRVFSKRLHEKNRVRGTSKKKLNPNTTRQGTGTKTVYLQHNQFFDFRAPQPNTPPEKAGFGLCCTAGF
jgi:hypothetical protein